MWIWSQINATFKNNVLRSSVVIGECLSDFFGSRVIRCEIRWASNVAMLNTDRLGLKRLGKKFSRIMSEIPTITVEYSSRLIFSTNCTNLLPNFLTGKTGSRAKGKFSNAW